MKSKPSPGQLSFVEAPRPAQVVPIRENERRRPRRKLGVVDQLKGSLRRGSRLATATGLVLGGSVPGMAYVVNHVELPGATGWRFAALVALIAGGLLFSAKSVWSWASAAFADKWKAFGFCVLTEGVMVLSEVRELSLAALILLVSINGVASGCILARDGP